MSMAYSDYRNERRKKSMKTLYLACNMGAAGDMLSAALLELHPDPAGMVDRLNALLHK
jgi:uncharacterized protein (DUF111 family)